MDSPRAFLPTVQALIILDVAMRRKRLVDPSVDMILNKGHSCTALARNDDDKDTFSKAKEDLHIHQIIQPQESIHLLAYILHTQ